MYVLKKSVNYKNININMLMLNENGVDYLESNYDIEDVMFRRENMFNNYCSFSKNPSFVPLLKNNFYWINLNSLCQNRSGIGLIEKYFFNDINENHMLLLAINESAMNLVSKLLEKRFQKWIYPENMNTYEENYAVIKLFWSFICQNRSAMNLLRKYPHNISISDLCKNSSAIHIIEKIYEQEPEKINWTTLSYNEAAIHLIEKNIDKIDYPAFAYNYNIVYLIMSYPKLINENSIYYIVQNENPLILVVIEKLIRLKDFDDWRMLCENPNIYYIIEQKKIKKNVCWYSLSKNPSIFEIDLSYAEKRCNTFKKELLGKVLTASNFGI